MQSFYVRTIYKQDPNAVSSRGAPMPGRKTETSVFPKQKQQQQQQNNAIKCRKRHGYNKGLCSNNSTSCMPPRCAPFSGGSGSPSKLYMVPLAPQIHTTNGTSTLYAGQQKWQLINSVSIGLHTNIQNASSYHVHSITSASKTIKAEAKTIICTVSYGTNLVTHISMIGPTDCSDALPCRSLQVPHI